MKTVVLAMLIAGTVAAQDQTGGIRGTVIDSVTHQPVRKATVSLGLITGDVNQVLGVDARSTDASGTFAWDGLAPGRYQLTIQHRSYPQGPFGGTRKTVAVKSGEVTGSVTVELVPGALVIGHIVDEDGDPLNGCAVQAKVSRPRVVDGTLQANSINGEYRLHNIPPGKYTLTAQCATPVFQPRPLSIGADPPPTHAYPKQVYPGTVDLAAEIEKSGIDFQMRPQGVTTIHAKLAPGDWQGNKHLGWQLIPDGQEGSWQFNGVHVIDSSNGAFDIPQVFQGSYHLVVASQTFAFCNGDCGPAEAKDGGLSGVQHIIVKDEPVETIVELRRAVDLHGMIEVEGGNGSNGSKKVMLNQIHLQSRSELPMMGTGFTQGTVNEDGTFVIKAAFPGVSHLRLIAPSCFLKSASLGGAEVTGGRIDLSSGAAGELRIVVSTNTASIRGTAPAGRAVMVVSEEDTVSEFSRGTAVGENGQFRIDGLPPGKYRVGIAEQNDPLMDEGEQEITLQEGQTLVMELKGEK